MKNNNIKKSSTLFTQSNQNQSITFYNQSKNQLIVLDIPKKVQIAQKFFSSQQKIKQLLRSWPNPKIVQLVRQKQLISLKNNAYFIGNICNNMIHGYGLILYASNNFYEGEFNNNFKHGKGLQYFPIGLYIGNYVNNKPDGDGTFIWKNGQIYQGQFSAGLKHGIGKWKSQNQIYEGEWKYNKPDGVGILLSKESKYQGQIKKGLKHGQGKELFNNGDYYIGSYVNGKQQGYGQYIWYKSKSSYSGEFKNGLRHGKGIWLNEGNSYEGNYLNDKKNGKGTFTWSSGNYYHGNYFDDLRHGYGQMYWANGNWYKGQWKLGIQDGVGQMYQVDKPLRKGIFQNNIFIYTENPKSTKKSQKQQLYPFRRSSINGIKNQSRQIKKQNKQHIKLPSCQKRKNTSPSIIPHIIRHDRQYKSIRQNNKQVDISDGMMNSRIRYNNKLKTSAGLHEDEQKKWQKHKRLQITTFTHL